ncbi:M20/M25/M40 family metallo-hydrolase [Desulfobacterales bacterium HSG17]|nr:M20/M25/M40 family metallo-hydrolase [Desulfobacterales bacterium HSG17]
MDQYLKNLDEIVDKIAAIQELIITNIVLLGQIPAPTFEEARRVQFFMDRLAEVQIDECSTDDFNNPIGVIRGTERSKPAIFVTSHLDTAFVSDMEHNFTIKENAIHGPGLLDNSVGVGVLISLPEILKRLDIQFKSDIILAGVTQSMGKGNLRGIRHLLKHWRKPIRAGVIIEGGELGRLNYYSDGMVRCEIVCNVEAASRWERRFRPNAILVLNDVINQILQIRLPQRPRSRIIIGKIKCGYKHGLIAFKGKLGFEIQSDSDEMVKMLFNDIKDIIDGIRHEHNVELVLKTISSSNAASLKYNHPLVKTAVRVMHRLGLDPLSEPSESELSIFLAHKIPSITVGLTHGYNYHLEDACMEIEPMFQGIAQIVGILLAIDQGVCDEV